MSSGVWFHCEMVQNEVDVPGPVFLSPRGVKGRGGITDFLSFHNGGEEPVLGETVQSGGRWPQTSSLMTFLYLRESLRWKPRDPPTQTKPCLSTLCSEARGQDAKARNMA